MPFRYFNIEEVTDYLHVKREDVERLVQYQEVPFEKQGGRVVFQKKEIDAWASARIMGFDKDDLHDYHAQTSAKYHDLSDTHALIPELLKPTWMLPEMECRTKGSLIRQMLDLADKTDLVCYPEDLAESIEQREQLCSTALPDGVALLHPRHHEPYMFDDSFMVFGRTIQAVHCGAPDGHMTDLFFMICCQDDRIHLHVLARLCVICMSTDCLDRMRSVHTAEEMYDALVAAEMEVISGLR